MTGKDIKVVNFLFLDIEERSSNKGRGSLKTNSQKDNSPGRILPGNS